MQQWKETVFSVWSASELTLELETRLKILWSIVCLDQILAWRKQKCVCLFLSFFFRREADKWEVK
jgi:hypothetical protein